MKLSLKDKEPKIFSASSFADLFEMSLHDCMMYPEYENAPRGQMIKEMTDVQLLLSDPTNNLFFNTARGVNTKYLAGELIWYFSADDSLEHINKFSKFWNNIANDDGTLNSAYGNLIFNDPNEFNVTGWQWVVKSLLKDRDSRQAILHFNRPEHRRPGVKDFPCTIAAQFMIRDGALNMYVTMRSNDFVFGLTYDLPFFTMLQQNLLIVLQEEYPDLKLGYYSHNAKSLHIYEKDFKIVGEMLDTMFTMKQLPVMEEPLVDALGNSSPYLEEVRNGTYSGSDPLLKWLLEKSND